MKIITLIISMLFVLFNTAEANNSAVNELIKSYMPGSAAAGNAEKGLQLWNKKISGTAPYTERSCATCHTSNLKQAGQHIRTKKTIDALAPSVNSERLSDVKKIRKWLKRNCKWTLGRECSAEEKTHLLTFLNQQ